MSACLPYRVTRAPQDGDRTPQIPESLGVPTEYRERPCATEENPPPGRAARDARRGIEIGQSGRGPSALDQCDSEGGQRIRLPFLRTRRTGEANGRSQFADRRVDIAEITQDDSDNLVRDRRVQQIRVGGERRAGPCEGFPRTSPGQRQQVKRLGSRPVGLDGSPSHARDAISRYSVTSNVNFAGG